MTFISAIRDFVSRENCEFDLFDVSSDSADCADLCISTCIIKSAIGTYTGNGVSDSRHSRVIATAEAFERLISFEFARRYNSCPSPIHNGTFLPIITLGEMLRFLHFSSTTNNESCVFSSQNIKNIPGIRLVSGSKHLLPFPAFFGLSGYLPETSSGCACHDNEHNAILNGVLEVVEHDVLLRNWFLNIPPTPVFFQSDLYYRISSSVNKLRYRIFTFISSLQNVPILVATSIIVNDSLSFPAAFFGFGTAFDLRMAVEKSALEAFLHWVVSRHFSDKTLSSAENFSEPALINYLFFRDPDNFKEILSYYSNFDVNMQHPIEHIKGCDANIEDKVTAICTHYDFYAINLTSPISAEPASVIKVFSPNAFPLFFGNRNPPAIPLDLMGRVYHPPHMVHPV